LASPDIRGKVACPQLASPSRVRGISHQAAHPRSSVIRFHGFASAVKTRDMGVRVEIEDGESLADGLKRLRVLLHEEGGHPISHAKWHMRRVDRYEKPSILRRRRRWVAVEKRVRGSEDLSYSNYFFTFELRPRRLWPSRSVAPDRIRRPKARHRGGHADGELA
jgi:ribosomal protein S21